MSGDVQFNNGANHAASVEKVGWYSNRISQIEGTVAAEKDVERVPLPEIGWRLYLELESMVSMSVGINFILA